ncbi:hypothetical protein FQZ97_1069080 [compost metagenome]
MPRCALKVSGVDVAVGTQLERIFAEAGHRDVASDAACLVQDKGVGDSAWLLGQISGGQFLEQLQGAGAGYLKALERSHVVHGNCGTGLPCLGCGDG